jgi:hypothetical protein
MENGGGALAASMFSNLIFLGIWIAGLVGMWKTFEKAGKPGWAAIIPIYNLIVLLEIIDRPMWWILLLLCTGPIGMILAGMDLGENFGKDKAFGAILLGLIWPVGYLMVGFSDAQYTKISRQ